MGVIYGLTVFLAFSLIVVIHEFGHFIAGKIFKVRVEVFSVGIGKRLFGWKFGETDYRISMLPIGGYVAFAGISDTDGDISTGASYEFPSKPAWQRIIISAAGPAMNIITGFMLAAFLFLVGMQTTSPMVGTVAQDTPAWRAGMQKGDRITRINGTLVNSFTDVMQDVALATAGEVMDFEIDRNGEKIQIQVAPEKIEGAPFPSIGVTPPSSARVQLIPEMAAVGFQNNDLIISVNDKPVTDLTASEIIQTEIAASPGKPVKFVVKRGDGTKEISVEPKAIRGYKYEFGLMPMIVEAIEDMPAAKAGIKAGDYIVSLNDVQVESWSQMIEVLSATTGEVKIGVLRDGSVENFSMSPFEEGGRKKVGIRADTEDLRLMVTWVKPDSPADKAGLKQGMAVADFAIDDDGKATLKRADGQEHYIALEADDSIAPSGHFPVMLVYLQEIVKADGIGEAISRGFVDCMQIIKKTYLFLAKLLSAELSPTLMSGPVGIEIGRASCRERV